MEYVAKCLKKKELLALLNGTLYSEKIINMYFKILEKMNLVMLSMENYQRQQQQETTPTGDGISSKTYYNPLTMKIQYLTTDFVRKLILEQEAIENYSGSKPQLKDIEQVLSQYFSHDLVLLPFFFDELN